MYSKVVRTGWLVLALALFAPTVPAQAVRAKVPVAGLRIEGETTTIVTKLPFDVVADGPADLYFWKVPAGWKYTESAGKVTITEAPEGTATVGLQTLRIDWDAKKVVNAAYTVSVNIGKVSPPTPPVPVDDPLVKSLQAAYDTLPASEAATKVADIGKLRSLHAAAVATCQDPRLKTYGQLTGAIHDAVESMIGGRLKGLREVLAAEKRKVLPLEAATPLDEPGRGKAAELHRKFSLALEKVK